MYAYGIALHMHKRRAQQAILAEQAVHDPGKLS